MLNRATFDEIRFQGIDCLDRPVLRVDILSSCDDENEYFSDLDAVMVHLDFG